MDKGTRPGPLTLLSAAMFSAPLLLTVAYCLVPLGSMIAEPDAAASFLEMAVFGGICSTIPGVLLLVEYRAIREKSPPSAACIAGLCLGLVVLGMIRGVWGIFSLVGVFPRDREFRSWWELVIYSALLIYLAFIGSEHRRWYRVLRDSKAVEAPAWDA